MAFKHDMASKSMVPSNGTWQWYLAIRWSTRQLLLLWHVNMQVLRCHTSAHQAELLRKGEKSFLLTGDVYRRDSIDASHYPVFHQMEGLYVLSDEEIAASGKSGTELAAQELKFVLSGLTKHLFGDVEMKFVDAYFPFTVSLLGLAGFVLQCMCLLPQGWLII